LEERQNLNDNLETYSKKSPLTPIITKNKLTVGEEKDKLKIVMGRGKLPNGWEVPVLDGFPDSGWENSRRLCLTVLPSVARKSRCWWRSIVSTDLYGDFELKI